MSADRHSLSSRGEALRPAVMPVTCSYERRRPEETTLYKIVQEQLETFLAHAEAQTGAGLLTQQTRDRASASTGFEHNR